jgi:hypothetical protein
VVDGYLEYKEYRGHEEYGEHEEHVKYSFAFQHLRN